MPAVAKIVARALRILRVVDSGETTPAGDFETARDALNAMLRRWEANGIALGWQEVENPTDEMPTPDEAERAIIFNLAVELRPEYGVAIDPDVIANARDGLAELRRDVLVANPLVLRQRLPRCGRFNIITGCYNDGDDC